ncbi:outer membrane lipoprotein chaperone LolA [Crenobacter sp. SG2303]|uniref:Outer-membrane lipoprotein carrier protein n=1 Tax=Crenobacter oryzisoli TaxID=3056844 RepID=A0ABT7XPD2_9NEIS|nr:MULTISPECIES: outer membrane lipoprotein chaperone LolA [unclassified Crenobacter]MDN0075637.1 outer membrane lipoprotein chaperone LolA [Crenobacter sp. SG2303]MDN0085413.1 outer membrane lipoprotein chaperone LolA [Crenobacter sp. SG2305]
MKKLALTLIAAALLPLTANAAAIAQLKAFVAGSKTLSANFSQVVTNQGKTDSASGTLEISRPGKFRWNYTKPYEQLIVGDGKRLWVYDKELAQVTTRPLDAALGSSPAAVLAGSNAIEHDYLLREIGRQGNIEWLAASPKKSENSFQAIRMGFTDNNLVAMELTDNFGNLTKLSFSDMKKNPAIAAEHFRFVPPKGADVMSDQ